jgi:hypothetical protein
MSCLGSTEPMNGQNDNLNSPAQVILTTRRHVRVLAAVISLLICVIVVSFWVGRQDQRQSYQEKPLVYWFNKLPGATVMGARVFTFRQMWVAPDLKYGSDLEECEKAKEAIRTIGTNALPLVFAKLARREYPVQKELEYLLRRCGFKRHLFEDATIERAQAVVALNCLSPLPEAAIDHLETLSTNADATIAAAASYC